MESAAEKREWEREQHKEAAYVAGYMAQELEEAREYSIINPQLKELHVLLRAFAKRQSESAAK